MTQKMTSQELARQTLIQLSKNQSPPTPENFQRVYEEISGIKSDHATQALNKALEKVLSTLGKEKPQYLEVAKKISSHVKKNDLVSLEASLHQLISSKGDSLDGVDLAKLLRYLLKQIDLNHRGITQTRKKEELNLVISHFANDPGQLGKKIQSLITSWGEGQATTDNEVVDIPAKNKAEQGISIESQQVQTSSLPVNDDVQLKLVSGWRDMLIRTINLIVLPQLAENPAAVERVHALINQANEAETVEDINALSEALKNTLLRAEMQTDTQNRMQESLLQMLRLLVVSMSELTIEDEWLHGQITIIQDIISKPLHLDTVYNAESSLKELIYKQSSIKPSLLEAKDTLKNMMSTFVTGLAEITHSTGTYQNKIIQYQNEIAKTEDLTQLNSILQSLVVDINVMSADARKSHEAFNETQQKVTDAEKKINELTVKLEYISEVAHQDFLTGALNRRGMDEAVDREFNRADRHNTPLSLAMIDIDHFKKINDTKGHSAGDVALAHLAKVVKSVLRSTDVLARYGGEEFLILLPGAKQDDAVKVISGVQRNLTKNFFLHESERVLITFSAGVAERMTGEQIDAVLPRADAALYLAKKSGRNRVVGAT
ncbi:MAG: GGDEF domain-containing protein [Methylophilus sp.]